MGTKKNVMKSKFTGRNEEIVIKGYEEKLKSDKNEQIVKNEYEEKLKKRQK